MTYHPDDHTVRPSGRDRNLMILAKGELLRFIWRSEQLGRIAKMEVGRGGVVAYGNTLAKTTEQEMNALARRASRRDPDKARWKFVLIS
jgi:YD repeat-containing protein